MWRNGFAPGLVLAELCRRCAPQADPLLELYGGCGRDAIELVQEFRPMPPPKSAQLRALALTARGILCLLIALTSFLLVTLATSRGR